MRGKSFALGLGAAAALAVGMFVSGAAAPAGAAWEYNSELGGLTL